MGKPKQQAVGATKKNPEGLRKAEEKLAESLKPANGEQTPQAKVGPGDAVADPRLARLKPLAITIGQDTVTAYPHTFASGSYGWLAVTRAVIDEFSVQVTITIPISGSKDLTYAKKK